MKQTAVEWLVEKIQQANPTFKFDALIRQAKEMEKEQIAKIVEAYNNGDNRSAELYYNETFKSE